MELQKNYDPKEFETKYLESWKKNGYFTPPAEKPENSEHFSIVIPPPNVTDILHLGHALNNLVQDVLIRYNRMKGKDTLWLPGTDHAGIATQNMVEKELAKDGKRKEDIGREEFTKMLWDWKEHKGGKILEQLYEIGASCDFTRTRFTLDEGFTKAVKEVFVRLHEQDLIYRGDYIINWCPRCKTALSDDEVDHEDEKGHLWYIHYPYTDDKSRFLTVATTRPETMLGDTGVAVHPDDERYADLIGKTVILPIVNKEIPVVADKHVDPAFGTGAVKITPAHDPNDFEIGNRHNLERIKVIAEDGTMTDMVPELAGMDRYAARERIIEMLKEQGLLEKIENHDHAVGHCYRCETTIEPYLSNQWFVRMKPLAEPAIAVVKRGKVKLHPKRWEGVYFNWLDNIKDWCISRQLWWGHQIPVYWCDKCGEYSVSVEMPEECPKCGHEQLRQDSNVLDTWFSSWLWPFATMGWPDINSEDLKRFFPTHTLSTANEIIFFWVARMIMASVHFMGEIPFTDVYFHGTVRDEIGRKMSKSLGNGIDPLTIVEKYGRDALRYTMYFQAAAGQDIFVNMDNFEEGRNFCNKLWNASRLVLGNIKNQYTLEEIRAQQPVEPEDYYILSKLSKAVEIVEKGIKTYNIADAMKSIYSIFWNDFCAWYLEMIKPRLDSDDKAVEKIALRCLTDIMLLLQPFTPFVVEELWHRISEAGLITNLGESITVAEFPHVDPALINDKHEEQFGVFQEIIATVRNIKATFGIPNQKTGDLHLIANEKKAYLEQIADDLVRLARLDSVVFVDKKPDGLCGTGVVSGTEIYMPLGDIIDIEKEIAKIDKELDHLNKMITGSEKKLSNEQFTGRAPENVIERERKKLADMMDKREKLMAQKKSMEG